MVYRMILLILIFHCLGIVCVYADDVPVLGSEEQDEPAQVLAITRVPKENSKQKVEPPKSLQGGILHEFIEQEDDRLREIRLLSLDLQRADLRSKLSKLDQEINVGVTTPVKNGYDPGVSLIKFKGIMDLGSGSQALALVNDRNVTVMVGDAIGEGYVVVRIDEDRLVLKDKAGKERIIELGG